MTEWVKACKTGDVDVEDLIRFDHGDETFAIYRSPDNAFFCTQGLCSHEQVHLCDGLVMDHEIECPKHNAKFDYRTGAVLRAPACDALQVFPVRVEGDTVYIGVEPKE